MSAEERYREALLRVRNIKNAIPFDAADAATECIRIAKEALGGDHLYKSTACQHGLCHQCRIHCKFCGNGCTCQCHLGKAK